MNSIKKESSIFKIILGIILLILSIGGFGSIISGINPSPVSAGFIYFLFLLGGVLLLVFRFKRQQMCKHVTSSGTNISTPKPFNLPTEQANFLKAIKAKWGGGVEFFAGDAFNMISEQYLIWFNNEAIRKNIHLINDRESATLELLEKFRMQGLLTKRIDTENSWYYTFVSTASNTVSTNPSICKAYKNGRCISQQTGKDTGSCSWQPSNWQNCGVVVESKKYYGKW